MNKTGIIDIISAYGVSKADANRAWDDIIQAIKNELNAVRSATLPGLGTLHVRTRAARPERPGRNPATGAALVIPAQAAKKTVVLTAAKALKEAVNG